VLLARFFFRLARRRPQATRRSLVKRIGKVLPPGYDVERHFSPRYDPWDQRLCLVPDNDLFKAISDGKVDVVTGEVDRFTPRGIRLKSGEDLEADLVVAATGLVVKLMGGIRFATDGEPVSPAGKLVYKGMMLEGVPNLIFAFGYTNASWTLKCDLTSRYLCRLLRHMDRREHRIAVPRLNDPEVRREPLLDFTSTYIRRHAAELPVRGSKPPWRMPQDYLHDLATFSFSRLADGAMEFRKHGLSKVEGAD
jgi:cation diffusion facilitator CzcD-associated flavoprotein CzcO